MYFLLEKGAISSHDRLPRLNNMLRMETSPDSFNHRILGIIPNDPKHPTHVKTCFPTTDFEISCWEIASKIREINKSPSKTLVKNLVLCSTFLKFNWRKKQSSSVLEVAENDLPIPSAIKYSSYRFHRLPVFRQLCSEAKIIFPKMEPKLVSLDISTSPTSSHHLNFSIKQPLWKGDLRLD